MCYFTILRQSLVPFPTQLYPWHQWQIRTITSRVTLYTAGHLHTAVPHCSHSRAPIVHTAVPRENNEHGCVYLICRAVCKLPGCVEGHPWTCTSNTAEFDPTMERTRHVGMSVTLVTNISPQPRSGLQLSLHLWWKIKIIAQLSYMYFLKGRNMVG